MKTKKEFTRVSYEEMKELVIRMGMRERYNVVSYLIGYNGIVDEVDWENIGKLFLEDMFEH